MSVLSVSVLDKNVTGFGRTFLDYRELNNVHLWWPRSLWVYVKSFYFYFGCVGYSLQRAVFLFSCGHRLGCPAACAISVLPCYRHSSGAKSCLTLCDPMDCSPPGSSVQGILQERILEWVAISFSRGSSWPRDQTCVSMSPALAGEFFTSSTTREAQVWNIGNFKKGSKLY